MDVVSPTLHSLLFGPLIFLTLVSFEFNVGNVIFEIGRVVVNRYLGVGRWEIYTVPCVEDS